MTRWLLLAGAVVLLAVDAGILLLQFQAVIGNLEAEVILGSWQTVLPVAWLKRRVDRQHAEQTGRQVAQAAQLEAHRGDLAAHRDDLAVVAGQVRELHQLHIHGTWPELKHQGR